MASAWSTVVLEQIERPGWQERWHLVEILRLKGWMLMRQGRGPEAEVQLRASINCARQQQAKSWELRSSTTLAELLAERGQRDARARCSRRSTAGSLKASTHAIRMRRRRYSMYWSARWNKATVNYVIA